MKILFHHRIKSRDGQFIHLREMLTAFQEHGHEVTLVGPKIANDEAFGQGGEFIDWVRRNMPKWVGEMGEIAYATWASLRLIFSVIKYHPDFIYERYNVFSPGGVLVSKLLGIPLALEINAPLFEERSQYSKISLTAIARWSQEYTWRNATLCLPVSGVLGKIVERYGVSSERILVLHNGIDTERFSENINREAARTKYGVDGKLVLGFIGFLRDWHRVDRAIRALASQQLPENTHVIIAGDGPEAANLHALTTELGLDDRVTFTGLVHWSKVPELLSSFDIALQPAVTQYASPLKLIEYLASGLAILAPKQDNIVELVKHDINGWVVDPSSDKEFNDALVTLCESEELRARLSVAARKTINELELSWRENAEKVVKSIEIRLTKSTQIPLKQRA